MNDSESEVNTRETDKKPTAELRKIRRYVMSAEKHINDLGIVPRSAQKFPFDIVGLATLSKAFAIAKACLKLLDSGHPDEAYGLSRSLVECAANLRYLTAAPPERDSRSHDFVKFAKADKAFWYHHTLASAKTPKEKADLKAYAAQMGISDNPKLARQHWSGQPGSFVWNTTLESHPIDGARTVEHRKKAYAVDYYLTSAYVHCSLLAIDNYFTEAEKRFRISVSSAQRKTFSSVLFIVLIHLYDSIGYVLFGLNTDSPIRLQRLYEKAQNSVVW